NLIRRFRYLVLDLRKKSSPAAPGVPPETIPVPCGESRQLRKATPVRRLVLLVFDDLVVRFDHLFIGVGLRLRGGIVGETGAGGSSAAEPGVPTRSLTLLRLVHLRAGSRVGLLQLLRRRGDLAHVALLERGACPLDGLRELLLRAG